ncbi:unnamed protein product [Closterium sp. NIES-54]
MTTLVAGARCFSPSATATAAVAPSSAAGVVDGNVATAAADAAAAAARLPSFCCKWQGEEQGRGCVKGGGSKGNTRRG